MYGSEKIKEKHNVKNVLCFGASSSRMSINKTLASYAASQIENVEVNLIDLNDFEMPIYSIDKENASGIPDLAHAFKAHIDAADGIVMSFAEHNGSYAAAFKNIYDWVSRIEPDVWQQKPLFLMATSPGKRGGTSVLEAANARFSHGHKAPIALFSLPSFYDNFSVGVGIDNPELQTTFQTQLKTFSEALG